MTEELKPCPFCGASASVMKDNGNENWPIKIWIQCDGCKMRGLPVEGPSCYGYNARFDKRDLPEAAALAITAWNRRAAPSQPEGAEPIWPKLTEPATVGAGTFGVGVSARLVVESAQRHYWWLQEERDNPKTPEQRREAEMSRRRLWDMLNGVTEAGAAAPDEGEARGIDLAARYVEKLRDGYVSEHGSYDPDTGATEFSEAGQEYVSTLDELAEGIRALSAPKGEAATPASPTKAAQEGKP